MYVSFKATFLLSARGRCFFQSLSTYHYPSCDSLSLRFFFSHCFSSNSIFKSRLVFSTSIIHPAPYEAVQAVSQIAISSLKPTSEWTCCTPALNSSPSTSMILPPYPLDNLSMLSFHYFLEINFNLSSHVYYSTIHLMYFCRCNSCLLYTSPSPRD